MGRNTDFLICLLIIIMDIVAGILGIEAGMAENKVKHLRMWIFECKDPSYQAFKLGLAAIILLLVAHTIANVLGGCALVRSKEEYMSATANQQLAFGSLFFSWLVLAVAFSLLILGTLSNSRSRKSCGIGHHNLLSIGGILCFLHGMITIAYFVSATAAAREKQRLGHSAQGPTTHA